MKALLLIILALGAPAAEKPPVRVGLALSGGAALGLAHIGVLKVLERAGIEVSCVSGNSMGAMIGAAYAAGYRAAEIESIAVNADLLDLFSAGMSYGAQYLPERQVSQRYAFNLRHDRFVPALPGGLVSLQKVEFLLMELFGRAEYDAYFDFDRLAVPFRAIAVDLVRGDRLVLDRGSLRTAVRASIAIPGVFPPVRLGDRELVDGGVQQYLPVDPLYDFNPDIIIAVLTMKHRSATGVTLIDVVSRSLDLVNVEDLWLQKNLADVVIEPAVDPFLHSDFNRIRELIRAGEAAAESLLPEIRKKIAGRAVQGRAGPPEKRPLPVVRRRRFEGLKITGRSLVERNMVTQENRVLDFARLRGDLVNINNTGLFEDVNYRLEPVGPETVDLVVVLEEKAYGYYSLGIRYDNTDDVNLGIEIGQGNLAGSGAGVRAAFNIGNPDEVRTGVTGTRIFNLAFGYRLDGFIRREEHRYIYCEACSLWSPSYQTLYRGGVAEAGYILGRDAFFNIGIKAHHVRNEFAPLPVFDTLPAGEWVIGPKVNVEYNDFDDLYLPAHGRRYRLTVFYSSKRLKSDRDFVKVECEAERIVPVGDRVLLNLGAGFGFNPFGEIGWSEYFRTGGDDFSGFNREEFTTSRKALIRTGLDLRLFNLFYRADYPLYLQLVADLGTFAPLEDFVRDRSLTALAGGLGAGLKTNTPIGPARFKVSAGWVASEAPRGKLKLDFGVGKDFRYAR